MFLFISFHFFIHSTFCSLETFIADIEFELISFHLTFSFIYYYLNMYKNVSFLGFNSMKVFVTTIVLSAVAAADGLFERTVVVSK